MFVIIRNMFFVLISDMVAYQPTLINLHPNEYNQNFHFYPFVIKLDRCFVIDVFQ